VNNLIYPGPLPNSGIPVSSYVLEKLSNNKLSLAAFYKLAKPTKNGSLVGWLFEMEMKYYLSKGQFFTKLVAHRPASVPALQQRLSIFAPVTALPAPVTVLEFDKLDDLVTSLVLKKNQNQALRDIWLSPTNVYNPFFDLAKIMETELRAGELRITIVSYQFTVALTHSRNGLIFQQLNELLFTHQIRIVRVTHHAVLPSISICDHFKWKPAECCALPQFVTRSMVATASSQPKKRKIHNHTEQMSVMHLKWNSSDDIFAEDEEALASEAVEFREAVAGSHERLSKWVTIETGCNYYVKDSLYSSIFDE
jgi:hypothetical protein